MMNDLNDPNSISGAWWAIMAAIAVLAGGALVALVIGVVVALR